MSFTAGAGTRFVVTSTASQSSGTALTGPITVTAGTATTNTPAFDITQTWNNAAVTFTGLRFNVTDTASNAASLLMDLQRGGASQFAIYKDGAINIGGIASANVYVQNAFNGTMKLHASYFIGWQNGAASPATTSALSLSKSSSDALIVASNGHLIEQRNGVNAQTFRIYNTFTDASNYERGIFGWVGNEFQIGTERAGTGVARSLYLNSASNVFVACANAAEIRFYNAAVSWKISGSSHFLAGADNTYDIGATGANRPRNVFWAGYQEMSEMTAPAAPAANSVRIYAEDNGAGKTRLMALFPTGAAQQIAIEP